MEIIIPSLKEMNLLNKNRFSKYDYADFILHFSSSGSDIVSAFYEIFFPIFEFHDGIPFNVSFGCYDKYLINLDYGMSKRESYYFSHIFDISHFSRGDASLSRSISNDICFGWNYSISKCGFSGISFFISNDEETSILPIIDSSLF
jgi:hypothetical protein